MEQRPLPGGPASSPGTAETPDHRDRDRGKRRGARIWSSFKEAVVGSLIDGVGEGMLLEGTTSTSQASQQPPPGPGQSWETNGVRPRILATSSWDSSKELMYAGACKEALRMLSPPIELGRDFLSHEQ